jgi:uncharacterized membrane protein HdeD (DUF308 family)
MKATITFGVLLVVAGVLALAYPRITYTERETLLDAGPVQAERQTTRSMPISPLIGAAAIISGLALLVIGTRKAG